MTLKWNLSENMNTTLPKYGLGCRLKGNDINMVIFVQKHDQF